MIILDVAQRSQEWFDAKLSIPSASNFGLIATATGEMSKSAEGYSEVLAAEYVSRKRDDGYFGKFMEEGIIREDEARQVYSFLNDGVTVQTPGLCYKDEEKQVLCSPDGLMPDIRGGLELKNPKGSTHLHYLKKRILPATYHRPMQGNLYVTKYDWWDWMSYYPGLPSLIIRIYPDMEFQAKFERTFKVFLEMLAHDIAVGREEQPPTPSEPKPIPRREHKPGDLSA